jgi:hypothetical protein
MIINKRLWQATLIMLCEHMNIDDEHVMSVMVITHNDQTIILDDENHCMTDTYCMLVGMSVLIMQLMKNVKKEQ